MPEVTDVHSALKAAEEAAAAGDLAAAEVFLRRAVGFEEAAGGPANPDLAETLNNLGIVCERLDKPEEAERSYRRAYEIAKASFPQDHPAVATSEQNLKEFCAARGLSFEVPRAEARPTPPPPVTVPPRVATPPPVAEPPPGLKAPALSRPEPVMAAPPGNGRSRSAITVTLIVAALLVVAIVVRSKREVGSSSTTPLESAPAAIPQPPAESPHEPPVTEKPAAEEPKPPAPVAAPPAPEPSRPQSPSPTVRAEAAGTPSVKDARLCRSLQRGAEWHCTPLEGTVEQGTVYFFTTVTSPADTTIQHRWYRGGRLHQSVTLRIAANPSGYRTYSQLTMTPARAGDWRVEVCAADGTVLGEKRFKVED